MLLLIKAVYIERPPLGRKISSGEVGKVSKDLTPSVENWASRDLSEEAVKYLSMDGTNFSIRIDGFG